MPGGRPTKYTDETNDTARAYLDGGYMAEGSVIPSVAGLALLLGVARNTIYDWASQEDKLEFSNILDDILSKQEILLINSGLTGDFNASIAKLALGKHGYSDKVEQDTVHSFDLSGHTLEQLDEIINSEKS